MCVRVCVQVIFLHQRQFSVSLNLGSHTSSGKNALDKIQLLDIQAATHTQLEQTSVYASGSRVLYTIGTTF